MQLSLCMAVPPYNHLRAGKLLAALAASGTVAREFSRRYGRTKLKSIVTTSANGLHSPIYNRIMVRPGGLYRRIGETTGYSALAFSKATLAAARSVVVDSDGVYSDNRTISTLKRAMNLCGLPRERMIRLGIRKGVYMALAGLDGWPDESDVLKYWSGNILIKAAVRDDVLERVAHSRSGDLLIRLLTESVKRDGH